MFDLKKKIVRADNEYIGVFTKSFCATKNAAFGQHNHHASACWSRGGSDGLVPKLASAISVRECLLFHHKAARLRRNWLDLVRATTPPASVINSVFIVRPCSTIENSCIHFIPFTEFNVQQGSAAEQTKNPAATIAARQLVEARLSELRSDGLEREHGMRAVRRRQVSI